MSNTDINEALRTLLERGVEASRSAEQRTRLTDVQEKPCKEWDDDEWELANQRGLIPPDQQVEYEMRLLERRQAVERASLRAWQGGNLPESGTATLGVQSGQIPGTPEHPVSVAGVREVDGEDAPPDDEGDAPYEQWTVQELQTEINDRNQARAEGVKVQPASQRKADLASALYADDERQPAQPSEG